ncbi:MAG TPA: carboxypeptidase-like regulatory domain-containing protein [Candidatus Acidoferrales bacterium]|nr:carboxypeptidase-like regulatory domain-containing protein [Candidatus Acidoferrales bacterium]
MAQTVEGSVFDAATGAGVGGVKVELLKGGTPFYETATDGGGRFRFDDVREGDYAARYQSPDYWLTASPSDYRLFRVAAESPVKLEARLMPWSRISGRVVDRRGNGVAKARVELTGSGMVANGRTYLRTSWGGGGGGQLNEAPMAMTLTGNTDAHGKFEVQLMPGTYGLSVVPPPELKPPDPEPDGPVLAWKRTYYPNVALADAASKIVVLPGGEVADVELKLLAVPVHAVRGVVLNPDGTPAPRVAIAVGEGPRSASVESKPDGTFEFPAVAEGEWRFSAEAQRGGVKLRATEWIEVSRHDLENVKLRLVAPLTLRGKVVMEVPKDAPAPRLGPLILSLAGGRTRGEGDLGFIAAVSANPDAKGDFIVQNAYPGVYRLGPLFQPVPPPYYLDSVQVGGANLAVQEVEVSSDAAITVVYKTDGGTVRGKVENCASGGVVLVPSDPALRHPGFSKSGPCDASGYYEVRAVRPGDYYALAFAGNGPVLALDDALLNNAVKVTVRAGEASSADLRTVTRPVY